MCAEKTDYTLENQVDDDFVLDDIEDLPGFVVFPTGAYEVDLLLGIEDKEINNKNFYQVAMTLVEVLDIEGTAKELSEDEEMPKTGDIATMLFDRSNKIGMGAFKDFMKPIASKFSLSTVRELKEVCKGLKLIIMVKRSYDKKSDRFNMRITKSQVI